MSILAFLSGLAGGASDAYGDKLRRDRELEDEQRQFDRQYHLSIINNENVSPQMRLKSFNFLTTGGGKDKKSGKAFQDLLAPELFGPSPAQPNPDYSQAHPGGFELGSESPLDVQGGTFGTPYSPGVSKLDLLTKGLQGSISSADAQMQQNPNFIYEHPDYKQMKNRLATLTGMQDREMVGQEMEMEKLSNIYGSPQAYGDLQRERYDRDLAPTGARTDFVLRKDGNVVKQLTYLDRNTGQWVQQEVPLAPGEMPASLIRSSVNDAGTGQFYTPTGRVGTPASNVGKTKAIPRPPAAKQDSTALAAQRNAKALLSRVDSQVNRIISGKATAEEIAALVPNPTQDQVRQFVMQREAADQGSYQDLKARAFTSVPLKVTDQPVEGAASEPTEAEYLAAAKALLVNSNLPSDDVAVRKLLAGPGNRQKIRAEMKK